MKKPYTLNFDSVFNQMDIRENVHPEWCEYPLAFASHKVQYILREFELFSQHLGHKPFFIDFVQLDVFEPVFIPFEISERQLFVYFTLKGSLLYLNEQQQPIIRTQNNNFLMSYYDKGKYHAYAEPGLYTAILVNVLPEWVESMYHNYPNLQKILNSFRSGDRSYDNMCQCTMDRRIHKWLYKIYSYSQSNIGALDGNIRKYLSYLLEYYDSVCEDDNTDLAYRIKVYIEERYCEPKINISFLSDHFFVTSRSLLNIFKRRYHRSVQNYIIELRMAHALQLMEQSGLLIKDVYYQVGYSDERTFRSALERYLKRQ